MGFFVSYRKPDGGFTPSIIHRLLAPRISGNVINGLGERERRRATPIYHHAKLKIPHRFLQRYFYLRFAPNRYYWGPRREMIEIERTPVAPIDSERHAGTPEENSKMVKEFALENGARLVGIARMRNEWVFEGYGVSEPYIIILGVTMDHAKLMRIVDRGVDSDAGSHIIKIYNHGTRTARKLADRIRKAGWHARGNCGPMAGPVNLIPAALTAGLGELGKHGSIINREVGANFRLAYVLTEMPLATDEPDRFGVDSFCINCQLCRKVCPPEAIFDIKQLVRGVEKWYVDFDKCVAYFNDSQGCGMCIAVCPWSRPGIAEGLARKMEKKGIPQRDGSRRQ